MDSGLGGGGSYRLPYSLHGKSEKRILPKENWGCSYSERVNGCWENKTTTVLVPLILDLSEISDRWKSREAESSLQPGTEAVALGVGV